VRLLDLFCGAGGAGTGYHRAGFEVVGVDLRPQPRYPFEFHQADALAFPLDGFDAIHASPPCQGYSTQTADRSRHPRLIGSVRDRICRAGAPYVIENVEGARRELVDPVKLCGSLFGLDLRRHRYFETSFPVDAPACRHGWQTPRFRSLDVNMIRSGRLASVVGVHGHINYAGEAELRRRAMGIDWMTNEELVEAIPPSYSEFIGRALLGALLAATKPRCPPLALPPLPAPAPPSRAPAGRQVRPPLRPTRDRAE
jgi:DNA (cytosine-5)-methyltransferase 1